MSNAGWMLVAWFIFSSVVSGMPAPAAGSSPAYRWAYATLHLLAGNLATFVKAAKP